MHLPNQNWDRKLSLKTWNFGDCSVEKTVVEPKKNKVIDLCPHGI